MSNKKAVLTERDERALRWVGEMGVADLNQIGTILAAAGENAKMTMTRARQLTGRWIELGLAEREKFLADRAAVVWLTRQGLALVGLGGKGEKPGIANLRHNLEVGDVRLYMEQKGFGETWASEKQLRRDLVDGRFSAPGKRGHVPDGVYERNGRLEAVEVERQAKQSCRLDSILTDLAGQYALTIYVVDPKAKSSVERAIRRLNPVLAERFKVRELDTMKPEYAVTGR